MRYHAKSGAIAGLVGGTKISGNFSARLRRGWLGFALRVDAVLPGPSGVLSFAAGVPAQQSAQ